SAARTWLLRGRPERDRRVARLEARVDDGDALLEVDPDAPVLAAVVAAAGGRAVMVDGAAPGRGVVVHAVAVVALADEVGARVLPLDDAFVQVLLRQREVERAAAAAAQGDELVARDVGQVGQRVLVDARLYHDA